MDLQTITIGIMAVLHAVSIAFHVRTNKRLKQYANAFEMVAGRNETLALSERIKEISDEQIAILGKIDAKGHHHK